MRLIAWSACLGLGLAGAAAAGRGAQVPPASDNTELTRMYQEDQDDRKPGLHGIDCSVVGPRDLARLKRTREL
jgi:hypothetical protein